MVTQGLRRRSGGVRPPRRGFPFIAAALAFAGVVMLLSGLVFVKESRGLQALAATDLTEIDEAVTFDGSSGGYIAYLWPTTGALPYIDDPLAGITCDVRTMDGSVGGTAQTVRGIVAGDNTATDLGRQIGTFQTRDGETTVTCRWNLPHDATGYYYTVAPSTASITRFGTAVSFGGGAFLAAAVLAAIAALLRHRESLVAPATAPAPVAAPAPATAPVPAAARAPATAQLRAAAAAPVVFAPPTAGSAAGDLNQE